MDLDVSTTSFDLTAPHAARSTATGPRRVDDEVILLNEVERSLKIERGSGILKIGRLFFRKCNQWLKLEMIGKPDACEIEGELLDFRAQQALVAWLNN